MSEHYRVFPAWYFDFSFHKEDTPTYKARIYSLNSFANRQPPTPQLFVLLFLRCARIYVYLP